MAETKQKIHFDPEAAAAAREADMLERKGFVLPRSIPRFSIGAFIMPPIWGAAHGQWATLLFYPLWVFTDSVFRYAVFLHTTFYIVGAVILFLLMLTVTLFYGFTAQKPAYYRVRNKYTPEQYIKRERVWSICMVIVGIAMIVLATYYNLNVFDPSTLHIG